MLAVKFLAPISFLLAAGGGGAAVSRQQQMGVVGYDTLIPVGLMIAAIGLSASLSWWVCYVVTNQRRDIADLRRDMAELKRQGRRMEREVCDGSCGRKD